MRGGGLRRGSDGTGFVEHCEDFGFYPMGQKKEQRNRGRRRLTRLEQDPSGHRRGGCRARERELTVAGPGDSSGYGKKGQVSGCVVKVRSLEIGETEDKMERREADPWRAPVCPPGLLTNIIHCDPLALLAPPHPRALSYSSP